MDKARHHLHVYIRALFAVGMLMLVPMLGPAIESTAAPIITGASVVRQARDGDLAVFVLQGNRHRAECQYEGIVAMMRGRSSLPEARPVITPFAKAVKPVSHPPGPQVFGEWRLQSKPGDSVTFVLRYSCHALWDTMVSIGPLEVER